MDFEKFKESLVEDVKKKLYEKDMDAAVSVNEVTKLNESYDALTVTPEGSNVGVNINLENFFEAYENGVDYNAVVDRAIQVVENGLNNQPVIDVSALTDYSQMKDKLIMEVVSKEANEDMLANIPHMDMEDMLANIPHMDMEDMAVVYRFVLDSNEDGRATILATNHLIEIMGVTPEQLHADAMENAPELKPAVIMGMSEMLAEMGMSMEMMGLEVPEQEFMYVATVEDKINGAGVLAYQNFMDQAAERVGGDFYILPSSRNEVLLVPDNGEMDLQYLKDMVCEVNATQVAPEEKLTDNVYHYDSKEKIFELGEKFLARQAERDADISSEKEEKGSVLGELKAKKEEVAKQPKKEAVEKTTKAKGEEL